MSIPTVQSLRRQAAHELVRHPIIKPAGDVLPFGKGERLPCQTYRFHI